MDIRAYLRIVRKFWWFVALTALLGAFIGGFIAFRTTPVYSSSVTFFAATPNTDRGTALQGDEFGQQRVNTYIKLLQSDRLAKTVIADAKIDMSTSAMASRISGEADLNTVLLTATVLDSNQDRGLLIATTIATEFPKLVSAIEGRNAAGVAPVSLVVVSGPTLSPFAVSPRIKLTIGLGLALGLVVGLLLAMLREVLDNTVRSVEMLRELTDTPVLGVIGRDSSAKKQPLIVETQARSIRAEAFRQLRTNLQFVDVERPAKVITITSSTAGEGKTMTAANLAVAFAEAGRRVLLIEADLRRPRVAELLDLDRTIGLTNVLAGQIGVGQALQPWGSSGLTLLPSGSIPPNPSELLGSHQMVELVAELRDQFDMVIVDTPPLLPVTDAAVAAIHSDGAVVVVRYGKTKRPQVARAFQILHGVDARILGAVLNMAPTKGADAQVSYHGYGYESDSPPDLASDLKRITDARMSTPGTATSEPAVQAVGSGGALVDRSRHGTVDRGSADGTSEPGSETSGSGAWEEPSDETSTQVGATRAAGGGEGWVPDVLPSGSRGLTESPAAAAEAISTKSTPPRSPGC